MAASFLARRTMATQTVTRNAAAATAMKAPVHDAAEQPFFADEPAGPIVKTAIPGPKSQAAIKNLEWHPSDPSQLLIQTAAGESVLYRWTTDDSKPQILDLSSVKFQNKVDAQWLNTSVPSILVGNGQGPWISFVDEFSEDFRGQRVLVKVDDTLCNGKIVWVWNVVEQFEDKLEDLIAQATFLHNAHADVEHIFHQLFAGFGGVAQGCLFIFGSPQDNSFQDA